MPLIVHGNGLAKLIASSGGITYSGGDVNLLKNGNTWCTNATMLTDTKAVITYSDAITNNLYALVVDMSKAGKIICGKPTLIANHGVNPSNYSNQLYNSTEIVRMNDHTALVVYNKAPSNAYIWYRYAIPVFVSKMNITSGDSVQASSGTFNNATVTAGLTNFKENTVVMVYTHNTPKTDCLAARIISLSNGTLSFTTQTIVSSVLWSGRFPRVDSSGSYAYVCAGSKETSTSGADYCHTYSLLINRDNTITSSKERTISAEVPHFILDIGNGHIAPYYRSFGNKGKKLGLFTGGGSNTPVAEVDLPVIYNSSPTEQITSFVTLLHVPTSNFYKGEVRLIYLNGNRELVYLPISYDTQKDTLTPGTEVKLTDAMLVDSKTIDGKSYSASLRFGAVKSTNFPLMTFWPNDNLQLMCHGEKA